MSITTLYISSCNKSNSINVLCIIFGIITFIYIFLNKKKSMFLYKESCRLGIVLEKDVFDKVMAFIRLFIVVLVIIAYVCCT